MLLIEHTYNSFKAQAGPSGYRQALNLELTVAHGRKIRIKPCGPLEKIRGEAKKQRWTQDSISMWL